MARLNTIGRKNLPLNALRAFEATALAQSFTQGARRLSVTQSAVSRHVAELEAFLGTRLFERRAQGILLTPEGRDLLLAVQHSFDGIELAVEQALRKDNIRIHVPPAFLQTVALDVIREFRDQNPGISIDVSSEHDIGRLTQDVDLAVVVDHLNAETPAQNLLWNIRCTAVCAPEMAEMLERIGLAATLESDELLHSKLPGEPVGLLWRRFAATAGIAIDHERGLAFDSMMSAVDTAMAGGGVALADIILFADRLRRRMVVAPFTHVAEVGYGYYLRVNPKRMDNRVVRKFQAKMVESFAGFQHAA